jgi:tartrate dehydrogenase/decarboxylase/D-malate dehydrogenase
MGAIWSAALMLDHLDETEGSRRVRAAVEAVCREGILTRDVGGSSSTAEVGDAVAARV